MSRGWAVSATVFVALLLLVVATAHASRPRGVRGRDAAAYEGETFTCKDQSRTVPIAYVNDDYCDCPGTSACSGSHQTFFCRNKGSRSREIKVSMVNDGLCDCCDGSDEWASDAGCTNTCSDQGKEWRQEQLEKIRVLEEGAKLKADLAAKAQEIKKGKQEELEKLKAELELKQSAFDVAEELKKKEEELETAERERRAAEKAAEEEAAGKKDEQQEAKPDATAADVSEETGQNDDQGSDSSTTAEDSTEENTENFPYPAKYAAPSAEKTEDKESKENFPYPAEYAPPAADGKPAAEAEADSIEDIDDQAVADALAIAKEDEEEPEKEPEAPYTSEGGVTGNPEAAQATDSTTTGTSSPNMPIPDLSVPHPAGDIPLTANEARDAFNKAQRERDDAKRKLEEVEKWLGHDFGVQDLLATMHGQCFDVTIKQYTYEMCPFGSAKQKENHNSVRLGEYEKYDADEQALLFTKGQKCWNGPERSLKVKMECGLENKALSVDEPSMCVYEMAFQTPVVCDHSHADALRLSLDAEDDDDV